MRSISARCTLFSKPEYACTTYHFLSAIIRPVP